MAILTGERCQCAECGATFRSVAAFDKHRVGAYEPGQRRCLNHESRVAIGMDVNAKGDWVTKLREIDDERR